jgi:(1->4)-alpha-D-glucan 1-alpha-D-glucosylmutase
VLRVVRELQLDQEGAGAGPDAADRAADAVAELAAWFPVYRSYLPFGREHLEAARDAAAASRPDIADTVRDIAARLAEGAGPDAPSERFQQTTGAIMAKGVEDNAFYRWTRLVALTEVGGEPDVFAISVDDFHRHQQDRQERLPRSMTTLTTHDTKRSEDTRARILALAELPERFERFLAAVHERVPLGDGSMESLLWQSILGAWPASRERLQDYALKASREAGASTGWTEPDEEFEARMAALVDAAFDDERVAAEVEAMAALIDGPGASNGLAAKLVQLTMPGVPDVYQGSERWERSLVDPDNRRPVEWEVAAGLLAHIDEGWQPEIDSSGAAKVLVTSRALRLRRDRPELFTGYTPLYADGERAGHLLAFDRGGAVTLVTRLPHTLSASGGWGDTTIDLGEAPMRDELTGRELHGRVPLATIFDRYPVALLAVTR